MQFNKKKNKEFDVCGSNVLTLYCHSEPTSFFSHSETIYRRGIHGRKLQTPAQVNESGRSMVEMLGVLAVIGVLSTTAIYGYKQAMAQYKANEIWNDLMLRAQIVRSAPDYDMIHLRREGSVIDFSSAGHVGESGYVISGQFTKEVGMGMESVFTLVVHDVPTHVCKKVVQMKPDTLVGICPNQTRPIEQGNNWPVGPLTCNGTDGKNDMMFYFDKPNLCSALCDEMFADWQANCGTNWPNCSKIMGAGCRVSFRENVECASGVEFDCALDSTSPQLTAWGHMRAKTHICL